MPAPKISVVMPVKIDHDWQIPMTECAIKTISCTTDVKFNLIVPEAGKRFAEAVRFSEDEIWSTLPPTIVPFDEPTGNVTREVNAGLDVAQENGSEFVVYIGNDIFVRPGWLEALLVCFEIRDCGAATLLASELKSLKAGKFILEGIYGPLLAFRSDWRFDAETFPGTWADSDMLMQMYEQGFRSYRNHGVVIEHFNQQTAPVASEVHEAAKKRFIEKHQNTGSHLRMYHYLVNGMVV